MNNPPSRNDIIDTMRDHRICVIIPTYNNAGTLERVISEVLDYAADIIVVNDGCTDATSSILKHFGDKIITVAHKKNKGKGTALKTGFHEALKRGYDYAITIDSDGQHYASEIPDFVKAIVEHPGTIIIGSRNLTNVDINGKSSFANKFSNFWFTVQTGRNLSDTQSGYRAYPLRKLYGLHILTSRYEAELELLVFAAWNGVNIISLPIKVYYPPQSERVSHFKPVKDFTRISILNTILCIGAIVYGLPVRFWKSVSKKKFFNNDFKPFTHSNGQRRSANLTLGRINRSLYSLAHFVFWTGAVYKPFVFFNFKLTEPTERKRERLHKKLRNISKFFSRYFPGGRTSFENKKGETFERPALIVANHQSHLDLPIIMSVHHKLIFLTNDWVWNNKYIGNIIHEAEYLPVSAGMDKIIPQLKSLVRRGYSVVVFPEGTRSEDCVIRRFHQGAFLLAQELNVDIVPMVLHGAGHFLPKNDTLMRRNPQTLRILERVPRSEFEDLPLRKQASMFRKIVCEEYQDMRRLIETPSYFKSFVLYNYAYRGWNTASRAKKILRRIRRYESKISNLKGEVCFLNSGIGVIPFLCALSNPDVKVYAYVEDMIDYKIFINTMGLPENLEVIHAVWHSDYNKVSEADKVFLITPLLSTQNFNRFNPVQISLTR